MSKAMAIRQREKFTAHLVFCQILFHEQKSKLLCIEAQLHDICPASGKLRPEQPQE
jgi:hypothetical protein